MSSSFCFSLLTGAPRMKEAQRRQRPVIHIMITNTSQVLPEPVLRLELSLTGTSTCFHVHWLNQLLNKVSPTYLIVLIGWTLSQLFLHVAWWGLWASFMTGSCVHTESPHPTPSFQSWALAVKQNNLSGHLAWLSPNSVVDAAFLLFCLPVCEFEIPVNHWQWGNDTLMGFTLNWGWCVIDQTPGKWSGEWVYISSATSSLSTSKCTNKPICFISMYLDVVWILIKLRLQWAQGVLSVLSQIILSILTPTLYNTTM